MKILVTISVRAHHTVDVPDDLWTAYQNMESPTIDLDTDLLNDLIAQSVPPIMPGWNYWQVDDEQYESVTPDEPKEVQ